MSFRGVFSDDRVASRREAISRRIGETAYPLGVCFAIGQKQGEHSDYVELAPTPSQPPPNATIVLSNLGEGQNTSPYFRLTSFCEMQMGGLRGAEFEILHNLSALKTSTLSQNHI